MENPDRILLNQFLSDPTKPVTMDSSPLFAALNAVLVDANKAEATIRFEFSPGDLFRQGAGFIQGGAVTAMLDFAMALVTFLVVEKDQSIATTSSNTSFLRPAKARVLVAEGKVERVGRRVIFSSASLFAEDKCIAQGMSNLQII